MFIGQKKIIKETKLLLEDILKGNNHNILFRAQSGYGKTTLALKCIVALGGLDVCEYHIPDSTGTIILPEIDEEKRIHVIDEFHTFITPEIIYPLLDSNKHTIFLLTNEAGGIKEPVKNRCIQFVFENYSLEEIEQILARKLTHAVSDEVLTHLALIAKGNPRNAVKLGERLNYILEHYFIPETVEEMDVILNEVLNIKDGLNTLEQLYLNFLEKTGRASLTSIMFGTNLDKETIMRDIEPGLLYQGKIKITPRGREIC